MAREFPIHNGRMTTDLDANGHKINNLPPGSGFTQVQSDWGQTDTTAPDYIKNKPTIPAPVTVDSALSATSENPVQNKAVAAALYTGFTEWVVEASSSSTEFVKCEWGSDEQLGTGWIVTVNWTGEDFRLYGSSDADAVVIQTPLVEIPNIRLSRHLITPTKTSQLTNDGAPGGGGTPYATTAQVAAKQDALSAAQLANIAAVPNKANTSDVNAALALKANAADLPYALVTPGEWEFSGSGYDPDSVYAVTIDYAGEEFGYTYNLLRNGDPIDAILYQESGDLASVFFYAAEVTATKTGIHLLDRAGNRVVVTGATMLTLPEANPGYLRDFLVRLEISGSTVPTITFAAPTGETITYETDGDEFPVPDEAGTWSYSFTENCVAHKFAVALKKVNTVAQGGS